MLSLVTSEDGSHTLFNSRLQEQYHSRHGAITESMHVFIRAGLHYKMSAEENISILEIGFGTGLNALLTLCENSSLNKQIRYDCLEPHPLPEELFSSLNYPDLLGEQYTTSFMEMHRSESEKEICLSPGFIFKRWLSKIEEFDSDRLYDVVYFDAFSPEKQPELWSSEVFGKLFSLLKPGSCLVTYCAKGEVKRTLKKAGFVVDPLQGPPGKREMVRALKP